MADFAEYGKTRRLFRDIIVTEKIDGLPLSATS